MTTILASAPLGLMLSDSSISDGDRVWVGRKVIRYKGSLFGFAGDCDEAVQFMDWWKAGQTGKLPHFRNSCCLILSPSGLTHFDHGLTAQKIPSGVETIGTGAKAAIAAFEALEYTNPRRAVALACKHDAGSRAPVRVYSL